MHQTYPDPSRFKILLTAEQVISACTHPCSTGLNTEEVVMFPLEQGFVAVLKVQSQMCHRYGKSQYHWGVTCLVRDRHGRMSIPARIGIRRKSNVASLLMTGSHAEFPRYRMDSVNAWAHRMAFGELGIAPNFSSLHAFAQKKGNPALLEEAVRRCTGWIEGILLPPDCL